MKAKLQLTRYHVTETYSACKWLDEEIWKRWIDAESKRSTLASSFLRAKSAQRLADHFDSLWQGLAAFLDRSHLSDPLYEHTLKYYEKRISDMEWLLFQECN